MRLTKTYLEDEISKSLDKLYENGSILSSLKEGCKLSGNIEPVDLDCAFTCYQYIVETVTLLRIYNERFYDEEKKELEENLESVQYNLRKDISDIFRILLD